MSEDSLRRLILEGVDELDEIDSFIVEESGKARAELLAQTILKHALDFSIKRGKPRLNEGAKLAANVVASRRARLTPGQPRRHCIEIVAKIMHVTRNLLADEIPERQLGSARSLTPQLTETLCRVIRFCGAGSQHAAPSRPEALHEIVIIAEKLEKIIVDYNPAESRRERLEPAVKCSAAIASKSLSFSLISLSCIGNRNAPLVMLCIAVDRGRQLSDSIADVLDVVVNCREALVRLPLVNLYCGSTSPWDGTCEIPCTKPVP
jgi:hypothetical protein